MNSIINDRNERYFYHSFPRRRKGDNDEVSKGLKILSSIRSLGLLLAAESVEWSQPLLNTEQNRIIHFVQRRACFTELSPNELQKHSETFGGFSLEFDYETIRRLGALPVLYVPSIGADNSDGSALATAIVSAVHDANTLISNISWMTEQLNSGEDIPERIRLNIGYAKTPEINKKAIINTAEAKTLFGLLQSDATPYSQMSLALAALTNLFYPADNTKHGPEMLSYYRQREWRISTPFDYKGTNIIHQVSQHERQTFLDLDYDFFTKNIESGHGPVERLGSSQLCKGIGDQKIIQMARRIIVPRKSIPAVQALFTNSTDTPPIVAIEDINKSRQS